MGRNSEQNYSKKNAGLWICLPVIGDLFVECLAVSKTWLQKPGRHLLGCHANGNSLSAEA